MAGGSGRAGQAMAGEAAVDAANDAAEAYRVVHPRRFLQKFMVCPLSLAPAPSLLLNPRPPLPRAWPWHTIPPIPSHTLPSPLSPLCRAPLCARLSLLSE
jgi:hypothetical protein